LAHGIAGHIDRRVHAHRGEHHPPAGPRPELSHMRRNRHRESRGTEWCNLPPLRSFPP